MARPRKMRRVCFLPKEDEYGPINSKIQKDEIIIMSVDEYETIRLIDFEDMTQEECSIRMNVARTTVQRIYFDARKKLANSLVNGLVLRIEGGDFKLCSEAGPHHGCGRCNRMGRNSKNKNGSVSL